jgi:prophage regulatory protein
MRLLDWQQLKPIIPYCRQHILRLEKTGDFPRRVRVGPGRVAWLESEVVDWIAARAAEREPALTDPHEVAAPPDPVREDLGGRQALRAPPRKTACAYAAREG